MAHAMRAVALCLIGTLLLLKGENTIADDYVDSDTPSHLSVTLPYAVMSSRFSDGITSANPFSSTSPSFELYTGDVADVQAMKSHRVRYPPTINSGNSLRFSVSASEQWSPSGAYLELGKVYRLAVDPNQQWTDGTITTSPDGYATRYSAVQTCWVDESNNCCVACQEPPRQLKAKLMQLICCVAPYQTKLLPITQQFSSLERMIPMDEGQAVTNCYSFGSGIINFRSPTNAELVCYANQAQGWYWDNAGSITVSLQAVDQPAGSGIVVPRYA